MENVKHAFGLIRLWAFAFLVVFILFSCGPTARFDYESTTDFSAYKTYNWINSLQSGLNDFDNRRVRRITDSLLQSRGYTQSSSPDFIINFYANEVIVPPNQFGIGIGTGGGNVAVGGGTSIPLGGNKLEQTFTLDFVDPIKDELLWQGVMVKKYWEEATPTQKKEHYLKVLLRLMKSYPPK